jgi:hypothetical protein
MWAIENCRTEVLGGHLDVCAACGDETPSYNSCRNRHCPKCQSLQQARWLEKRKARILPTHYFHVVFTVPAELRALCRNNPVALYDLLFAAASQTLCDFGRNELHAQLGITCVLHTWTRDLRLHPHVHCVVTGGGFDAEHDRWVPTTKRFLFPVKALAKRFRGKFLDGLRTLHRAGALRFEGACADLADRRRFQKLIDVLHRTNWVVYAKPPFGGPEQVFEYLGRYTHRVAISNSRLVGADDREVRFRTRDGRHASLPPEVFIGRYLLHVLPPRFVKLRHYGLLASCHATTRLEAARARLLASDEATSPTRPSPQPASTTMPLDWRALLHRLSGIDPRLCPRCGGLRLRRALPIPKLRTRTAVPSDTS